jgi:tetratricopeptide (TPR) repeat protein
MISLNNQALNSKETNPIVDTRSNVEIEEEKSKAAAEVISGNEDIINEIPDKEKYTKSELNRLGACYIVKKEGNEFFKKGEYSKAIESYEKLERYMGLLLKGERHLSDPIRVVAESNMAICYIKLGQYSLAEEHCEKALAIDSKNIKALYRRAVARMEQGKYIESNKDLLTILEYDPSNTAAHQMLRRLKSMEKESNAKLGKMYGGIFEKLNLYEDKNHVPSQTRFQVPLDFLSTRFLNKMLTPFLLVTCVLFIIIVLSIFYKTMLY